MINISADSKEYKYYGITELQGYQMGLKLAINTNDTNLQEFFERKIDSYERKIKNRRKASQEKRRVKLSCVYKAFITALEKKIDDNELPMVTLEEIQDASSFPLSTNTIAYYLNTMDNEEKFIEQQSDYSELCGIRIGKKKTMYTTDDNFNAYIKEELSKKYKVYYM